MRKSPVEAGPRSQKAHEGGKAANTSLSFAARGWVHQLCREATNLRVALENPHTSFNLFDADFGIWVEGEEVGMGSRLEPEVVASRVAEIAPRPDQLDPRKCFGHGVGRSIGALVIDDDDLVPRTIAQRAKARQEKLLRIPIDQDDADG